MLPADSGIEVVVMRDSPDGDIAREALPLLSAEERQRASRFVLRRDRERFIERRARLRRLVGERLGIPAPSVRLSSGVHGKPALAAPFDMSGITFNHSHSGDLSVYAFASRTDVGVDVETIRVVDDANRIAAIAFSQAEYDTYTRLPVCEKPIAFLRCWTLKEAFVKATGAGLSHPLDTFDVSFVPVDAPRLLRLGSALGDCGWRMHSFFPGAGFVAAVAAKAAS
jgi:4'-phosphopantetheinyl transferase